MCKFNPTGEHAMSVKEKDQGKYGLKVENLSPDSLKPNKWNSNHVSPADEAKLLESIKRNGFFKPALARELSDGSLELIGGEHRVRAAQTLGYDEIPVMNLGKISDKKAKELMLLDNARYGSDDTLALAALLNELGSVEDITSFMPFSDSEVSNIFASVSIDLDMLDMSEEDMLAGKPKESMPAVQTHQTMRFRVPTEDVQGLSDKLEKVMRLQGFDEKDSLVNAGDALVWLLNRVEV